MVRVGGDKFGGGGQPQINLASRFPRDRFKPDVIFCLRELAYLSADGLTSPKNFRQPFFLFTIIMQQVQGREARTVRDDVAAVAMLVRHRERAGDGIAHRFRQRTSGRPLDHGAEDVEAEGIVPARSRREQERRRREPPADRRAERSSRPQPSDPNLTDRI